MLTRPLLQSKIFVIVLFSLVGLVVYASSLGGELFWDDDDFVVNNQYVRSFEFGKFFSQNLIAGAGLLSNYWRPVLLTVFSLEWQLWGDWAGGFHFVNVAFHIADTVLLFFVLLYLFSNRWLALFSSLIFLVHPL